MHKNNVSNNYHLTISYNTQQRAREKRLTTFGPSETKFIEEQGMSPWEEGRVQSSTSDKHEVTKSEENMKQVIRER